MRNFFKNILPKDKKQINLNEDILKKYPNIYRGIYKSSRYKHIFASIGLVIGLIILLFYNKSYKSYVADTTSVFFIQKEDRFAVSVVEDGKLKRMDLLPFFKNYGDSFMFFTDIKDSLVNIETDHGFRMSFIFSKNINYDNLLGDVLILNYDFDSLSLSKLKNSVEDKFIILNKKCDWNEKSNYILYKDKFSGDVSLFEYGKLFVLLKSFPYGVKVLSFDKER